MLELFTSIKKTLNLNRKESYPKVELIPFKTAEREWIQVRLYPYPAYGFDIVSQETYDTVGTIVIKNIPEVGNVVDSVSINSVLKKQLYNISAYIQLAEELDVVYSGEFEEDGTPTSFVSIEAKNVWDRLTQIFKVEKLPIQGNRFRYCLRKENI